MKFEENPFCILQVSIYDTKATIIERADDLSFADPDREEIINQARDILLNPKKRIAAEMHRFDTVDIKNLFPLAGLNKLIYSLNELNLEDKVEAVIELDNLYSALDAEEIREQINTARAKSKFPAVQDTAAIKSELKNIRYDIRDKMQDFLEDITRDERLRFATDLADYCNYADDIGVVIEDFFECYRLHMTPFFEETTNQIRRLLIKIKLNANKKFLGELDYSVKNFCRAMKPLDELSLAVGMNNFDESKELFREVRSTAIDMFNEKNLVDEPLRITKMLAENFSHLPPINELIRKDIKFLEETKARRPTQSFLDAKAALDKIQSSMDQYLHLEQGFEQTNLDFYEKIFKPNCEVILTGLMLPDRHSRKPEEWTALNLKVAVIYLHMGNAMTWARRADLALEYFQKAFPYAEASGDAELISLARKRVDEWREINRQIDANASESSSGCFSVVAVILIAIWLILE